MSLRLLFLSDLYFRRAPSPSMREAIQGMLSMSRGGLGGMQLFSRAESRRQGIRSRSALAEEDEEEKLSKCYQDDEFGKLLFIDTKLLS